MSNKKTALILMATMFFVMPLFAQQSDRILVKEGITKENISLRVISLNGVWLNEDKNSIGIPRVIISNDSIIHVYGKCSPVYCDWGEALMTAGNDGKSYFAKYVTSFNTHDLTIAYDKGKISIEERCVFTDNSGRAPYTSTNTFYKASPRRVSKKINK